jgi:hypothetical protein
MVAALAPEQIRILNSLPRRSGRLFLHLRLLELPLGKVRYGEPLRHLYFPIDSIVSLLYVLEIGASADSSSPPATMSIHAAARSCCDPTAAASPQMGVP